MSDEIERKLTPEELRYRGIQTICNTVIWVALIAGMFGLIVLILLHQKRW